MLKLFIYLIYQKIYENNIIFINNQNSLLYSLKNSNANENFIAIISKVDFFKF